MQNIVLIGMPGAGKSTVGVILAKKCAYDFVDTDCLIQTSTGKTLQTILDAQGYLGLRRIEEDLLLGLDLSRHVIATGGSAVYSTRAMQQLKKGGVIVFLDVPLAELCRRVNDFDTRGIAAAPGQDLAALFAERRPLYRHWADLTIDCPENCDIEQLATEICRQIS